MIAQNLEQYMVPLALNYVSMLLIEVIMKGMPSPREHIIDSFNLQDFQNMKINLGGSFKWLFFPIILQMLQH